MSAVSQAGTNLTLVSVCYNSSDHFLAAAWRTFLQTTQHAVIIVDNNSPDGSGAILHDQYPQHLVLRQERNLGYGRAANAGINVTTTRYVLLLNPDITIAADSIECLLAIAESDRDNTAIWAPVLRKMEHSNEVPRCVESVSGAAMLFDLQQVEQTQLFDSNIFLYSEETDLCYRIRQQGKLIKQCPAVYMQHHIDGSSGHHPSLVYMKAWHFAWSRCYFLEKHRLCTAKRNPQRMYRDYKLKSYISLGALQRLRYRAQAAGVQDFLRGETAFTGNGDAKMSDIKLPA